MTSVDLDRIQRRYADRPIKTSEAWNESLPDADVVALVDELRRLRSVIGQVRRSATAWAYGSGTRWELGKELLAIIAEVDE